MKSKDDENLEQIARSLVRKIRRLRDKKSDSCYQENHPEHYKKSNIK